MACMSTGVPVVEPLASMGEPVHEGTGRGDVAAGAAAARAVAAGAVEAGAPAAGAVGMDEAELTSIREEDEADRPEPAAEPELRRAGAARRARATRPALARWPTSRSSSA